MDQYVLPPEPAPLPEPGTVISFDVTNYVAAQVDAGTPYVGLMIRAGAPGGMQFGELESNVYPQLVIETGSRPVVLVIVDPSVEFEVIDVDDGSGEFFFDGIGDYDFPTFNDAVLGSFGEARSMAEFDISGLSVPPGQAVTSATYEVRIPSVGVFGLGVDGEMPEYCAVEGYTGNGFQDASNFQIAE